MGLTGRILLTLLLVFSGQVHAQLALIGAGKGVAGGGGGGGDSVAVNNSISGFFSGGPPDGTTSSVSPGGTNRALFMGVATGDFGTASTIDDAKYGGSGGTSLSRLAADQVFGFGGSSQAAWGIAGSPSGSTTLFGDWSGTPVRGYVAGAFLENVNQTTPFEGVTTNSGANGDPTNSEVVSVTITGMVAGQKAIASVACSTGSADITAFTAIAGTTIVTQSTSLIGGIAILYGTASGSSITLSANCNQTTANFMTWAAMGVRINP